MVYCCIDLLCPSIDPSIVSIKKLVFRPCARFRYLARKYVDTKSAKGRFDGPRTDLAGKLLMQSLSLPNGRGPLRVKCGKDPI